MQEPSISIYAEAEVHCTHIISASIKIYCPCPHFSTLQCQICMHRVSARASAYMRPCVLRAVYPSHICIRKEGGGLTLSGLVNTMAPCHLLRGVMSSCHDSGQVAPSVMYHRTNCMLANLMQPDLQNMARKCVTFITPGCKTFIIIHKALIKAPELLICILRFTQ